MKIPTRREIQYIAPNYLSDIAFADFMKLYKDYTKELFPFLRNDATFSTDNPLRFRKSLF